MARRHAREAYDEFADKKADLVSRARTQREWSSQGVRNAMKKSPDNDKIRRKAATRVVGEAGAEGAPDGVADRPARGGRGAAQGVGAAVQHRRRAPVERGGRDPQRGDPAARRLPVRPGLAAGQRARPDRHHRPQRRRQDHADPAAARPASSPTPAPPAWAPRSRSARSTRPAPASPRTVPLGDAVEAALPELVARRRPHPAGEVRAQGRPGRQPGRPALAGRAHPRRARAAPGPRGQPAGARRADQPPRPARRSSSSRRRWRRYDGALLLVSHDRRLLDNVTLDRRWRVEAGVGHAEA